MKKIFLAAMTLVMAVFASCSNDDAQLEGIGDIKVNFTVADKAGFDADTRAVKTGWEANDEILIVFYNSDGWYNENGYNYMKLTYNGSAWTTDVNSLDKTRLLDEQLYMAIYHPGTITFGNNVGIGMYELSGYKGGEYLTYAGDAVKYTYDGANIDLGIIALERHVQDFQISIEGLESAGKADGTWELYIQDAEGNRAHNMYFQAAGNAFLRDTGFGSYDTHYSTGINYKGDVVFYFSNAGSNETSLKFVLTDDTDTYTYTTTTIPDMGNAYTLPAITNWTKQ